MPADIVNNDLHVNGTLSSKSFNAPPGSIGDADIEGNAGIQASKVVHQHAVRYHQAGGTDVVAATVPLHIFYGDAEILAVEVVPITAPTGGDKAFTVDVKKGNQAGAYATILSSVITINSGVANRQVVSGTLSTTTALDGDSLTVVVAVSGSTGSQGQGVVVIVWLREDPQ